jgi:hypothetical protein
MEIFEALVLLFDGCMCFLELATLFSGGTTAYTGVRTYKKRKAIDAKAAAQPGAALRKPSWWPFVLLLMIAVGFTALTLYKYSRAWRR